MPFMLIHDTFIQGRTVKKRLHQLHQQHTWLRKEGRHGGCSVVIPGRMSIEQDLRNWSSYLSSPSTKSYLSSLWRNGCGQKSEFHEFVNFLSIIQKFVQTMCFFGLFGTAWSKRTLNRSLASNGPSSVERTLSDREITSKQDVEIWTDEVRRMIRSIARDRFDVGELIYAQSIGMPAKWQYELQPVQFLKLCRLLIYDLNQGCLRVGHPFTSLIQVTYMWSLSVYWCRSNSAGCADGRFFAHSFTITYHRSPSAEYRSKLCWSTIWTWTTCDSYIHDLDWSYVYAVSNGVTVQQ